MFKRTVFTPVLVVFMGCDRDSGPVSSIEELHKRVTLVNESAQELGIAQLMGVGSPQSAMV